MGERFYLSGAQLEQLNQYCRGNSDATALLENVSAKQLVGSDPNVESMDIVLIPKLSDHQEGDAMIYERIPLAEAKEMESSENLFFCKVCTDDVNAHGLVFPIYHYKGRHPVS